MKNASTDPDPPNVVTLTGNDLRLRDIEAVSRGDHKVVVASDVWRNIARGRACVDDVIRKNIPAYGITTGVGSQKNYRITTEDATYYNSLLVRAHGSRGPGPVASPAVLRGAVTIHLNGYVTGASGVRPELVKALLAWLERDEWPEVRLGHSVGASDLMSLGQLADGFLTDQARLRKSGHADAIDTLAAKEGLSFINSNSITLSQGALALCDIGQLLDGMNHAAVLSIEGFRGNLEAWGAHGEHFHPQRGQQMAAPLLRRLLEGSRLWEAGQARLLQDPLSLRCVPQIHGACYAALAWARSIWEVEINAVVDNPTVDLDADQMFSHGNMETTILSVALDALRLALAKGVEASGERIHKVQWPSFTGLPTGLATQGSATGGVQFLSIAHLGAAQVAAAKAAAMPATPHYRGQICDGVEDVGGVAPLAVSECERLIEAAWIVVGVEAAVGAWAIARRGIDVDDLGYHVREVYTRIRAHLPIGREGDKPFDLAPIINILKDAASSHDHSG